MDVIRKAVLIVVLILLVLVGFVGFQYHVFKTKPIIQAEKITLSITPGANARKIASALERQPGITSFSPFWFEVFVRLEGQAGHIQVGEYELQKGLTAQEVIEKVLKGQVVQHAQVIVDGWTVKDLLHAIRDNPSLKIILSEDPTQVIGELGVMNASLEGLFFPETYYFPVGSTDKEFLMRAYDVMAKHLKEAWAARGQNLAIKTPYEALVLASIIQKESGLPEEWPLISEVFHNRIKKKMRLQADPTVIYGLGDAYTGKLSKADLQKPTPYNTYTISGLPPTPIALPSFGAILAACRPAEGEYLYFVAKGNDGSHQFSATLEEHNAAVLKQRTFLNQTSNPQS